jgi:hypothetical protein
MLALLSTLLAELPWNQTNRASSYTKVVWKQSWPKLVFRKNNKWFPKWEIEDFEFGWQHSSPREHPAH